MVTWVRGLFKDIHGKVELHREDPLGSTFGGEIDATGIWTGEPDRDAHLRSADFLDVENHPAIAFRGRFVERTGDNDYRAVADLTLRGVTREVSLEARAVLNPGGGVVVSNEIRLVLDVEAILDDDLERVGSGQAVYRSRG
ncbi:hypothetical protein BH24ACT24_BH24ACT24_08330 [soil metagenome]